MKTMRLWLICLLILAVSVSAAFAFEYPEGTLHRGIQGHQEEVEALQYLLFSAGYLGDDTSEIDGVYGQRTEAAVRQFQKEYNLEPTGVADPYTVQTLEYAVEYAASGQNAADPYPYCYVQVNANGTSSIVLCPRHMYLYAEADALMEGADDDFEIMEAMQSSIVIWLEDIDSLYKEWISLQPEYTDQLLGVQEAFMDYYRANLALWNAQYGSPSLAALSNAQTFVADYCIDLCMLMGGTF